MSSVPEAIVHRHSPSMQLCNKLNDHEKKILGVRESLKGACDQLTELEGVVARLSKENKKQLDYLNNYTQRENSWTA